MHVRYLHRTAAGWSLGHELAGYRTRSDLLVLAIPRGGVCVAEPVAAELDAPMDVILVRKLGVPGQEELAMGAVADGGVRVLNEDVIRHLGIPASVIDRVTAEERRELRRRQRLYRGDRPAADAAGRRVILIDDGLATGASMLAAGRAVRQRHPAGVIVAVPVASPEAVELLRPCVEAVCCPMMPADFGGVGRWYDDFRQVSDDEVRSVLQRAWAREANRREPTP